MSNPNTTSITITRSMITMRNMIYFILLITGFIYLLVLYMISLPPASTNPSADAGSVDYFFYGFLLAIIVGYILNQRLIIPKAQQIEEPFNRFGLHMVVIILGIDGPYSYAVVIGFISFNATGNINWVYVSVLTLFAFMYGVYFYLFHYQPTLSEIEVGKTIEKRIRQ